MTYKKKIEKNEIRFRCSELGKLMVSPRTKKAKEAGELSETTKSYLVEKIGQLKYGIHIDITGKQIDKGNYAEADAVTMMSKRHGKLYMKNKVNLHNDYITGTPDIISDEAVIDTKCPYTWLNWARSEVTRDYEWQLRGYMMLTGKKIGVLAFCLVDLPEHLLYDELKRQSYYRAVLEGSPEYDELEEEIRMNMTYERIPEEKKVREFQIMYDEEAEQRIIHEVEKCRLWILNEWENY